MSSEWREVSLEEVCEILDSKRKPIRKSDRKEGVFPYYGASGISDYINGFVFDGTYLLLSEDGDNLKTQNTPIAFLAKGKFWVNNHAHVLQGKDGNVTEFICYALQVADTKSYISGSTRPKITQGDMRKIKINLPPLPEQKAIAHILGKLDDKIELNRQMNQTLEQMAQALFQSWFVDFDPVLDNAIMAGDPDSYLDRVPEALATKAQNRRAVLAGHGLINRHSEEGTPEESHHGTTSLANKAENRQAVPTPHGHTDRHSEEGTTEESHSITSPQGTPLILSNPLLASQFPNTFTFNETLNKWIPEGWEGGNLGDRYFVKGGYAFKSKDFIEAEGTPVVKIKNIKADKTIDNSSFSHVKTEIAQQREDFWLETGDILMAMTGATVGKFGFIVKKGEDLIVLNQRVAKFYPKLESIRSLWFIYCFFDDNRNTDFIENTAEGSAQPNISANDIMSAPMILPEKKVLSFFEKVMSKKFNRIIANQKQTETLTQLREVLLPQLISGKLKVPEALLVLEKEMKGVIN